MKRTWFVKFACFLLLMLVGCSDQDKESGDSDARKYLYYLNAEESKLIQKEYEFESADTNQQIEELIVCLKEQPKDAQYLKLLPEDLPMPEWTWQNRVLWLDFDQEYYNMDPPKEVLVRAGLVRMFTQLTRVEYVGILVDGQELENSKEEPIGVMNADNFVESSGKEVNAYEYVTLQLYFTDEKGAELVKEERKVYYSKNAPRERAVIEQLLKGPKSNEHHPTVAPETKILGVTAMDGIGYVNLDEAFLNSILPVQPETVIESIVRSLTASCDITKVQIAVNGETKVKFKESISLDQFFDTSTSLRKSSTN